MGKEKEQPMKNYEKPLDTAHFGMGCFWKPEAKFPVLKQVKKTQVGYAGGSTKNPTYQKLGDHTEVVKLHYNSSYKELLEKFWEEHNYTRENKKQYRSLILVNNEKQRRLAKQTKPGDAVTRIKKLNQFYLAETYHQKYRLRHSKYFKKFRNITEKEFNNSEKPARYNAVAAGYLTESQAENLMN